MGCKFSNKENKEDDQNEILLITCKKNSDTKFEEEPQIRDEAGFQFKISDLIGERKGNINDHYNFVKILGEGSNL